MIITVTLDNDYLTAADRAFPVVISSSQTADTCVCEGFSTTNYYAAAQLRTGYDTDYSRRRTLIRFNIPSSIPIASVLNARLDVEKVSGATPGIYAKRITQNWTSSAVTWNSCPPATTKGQSSVATLYSSGSSWYTIDVTSIVQEWVNLSAENYGFLLLDDVENDPAHWTTWYSSDADSPHKPELYITYGTDSSLLTEVPCYLATNCWRSNNAFTFNTITSEINSGRPLLLGFANTEDSPYPGAHMTTCSGYLISDAGKYVYVSDAFDSYHKQVLFSINTYNDFVSLARIIQK